MATQMNKLVSAAWIFSCLLAGCAQASSSELTPTSVTSTQQLLPVVQPATPQSEVPTQTTAPVQLTPTVGEPSGAVPSDSGAMVLTCSGDLTSPNMEGPYYTPGSPERNSLIETGMPGTPILISGQVFNQECNPIPGARVDFWQADANGVYDNAGFTLRGHVISDQNGYYAIETIAPGLYTGRPAHIHVKVFAPDGRELLTTQLYFPGSEDSPDVQTAPDLLVSYQGLDEQSRQQVLFNFVVPVGP